jgi:hypothetical protein
MTDTSPTKTVELRFHPKLQEIWPPEPGGAFAPGTSFPQGGEDVLQQVFYYAPVTPAKANVSLKTVFQGHPHTRHLFLQDAEFAQALAVRLRQEIGRTIQEIGGIKIDF